MLSIRYVIKNKKQAFTIITSIILASILLFSVGILFSSFREYLIKQTLKEADFHVRISGDLEDISKNNIVRMKLIDGEYYIKFKDIFKTYDFTDEICDTNICQKTVYNYKLLSLYGIGENNYLSLFKNLIILIVFVLALSSFFIIYNSFSLILSKKQHDIALFKAIGSSNSNLYKIFFLEGVIYAVLGIGLGFGLSLLTSYSIIYFINNILSEVFSAELSLYIYLPFVLIPLIFIVLIIFLAIIFPIFKIKKYKMMEAVRKENNYELKGGVFKSFVLNYAYVNYQRNKKKYRGIIMCIFISALLFNSFMRFGDYTATIIQKYVTIPKYDVMIIMNDSNMLKKLVDKFKPTKKTVYRFGYKDFNGYKVLVTDLGKNEVINKVREISFEDKALIKESKHFDDLDSIILDGKKIMVNLTEKVPFGFENELSSKQIILNLDKALFDEIILEYENAALIKTDKNKIDEMIKSYALENDIDVSYNNVKKSFELINSFILLIKIFIYFCVFITLIIAIFAIFNIMSASIQFRKREFASLKVLGLDNFKISLCLFLESLIVVLKGIFYVFPFILLISSGLYENIGNYFQIDLGIMDYKIFVFSFLICFCATNICMNLSHLNLYRKPLILNIKGENL